MEWFKILALCLSCFSLGISLTGLSYSIMEYRRAGRALKRLDAQRAELAKKEEELKSKRGKPTGRGCFNCKHFRCNMANEPCFSCDIPLHSNWEPKEEEVMP